MLRFVRIRHIIPFFVTCAVLYCVQMGPYIEIVILDNFVVTACIAGLAYASLGMRVHKRRTALVALAGTLISVFYPFWTLPTPLLIAAKLAVGLGLGVALFMRLGRTPTGVALFFLHTAVIGGICIFVQFIISGDIGDALTGAPSLPYCLPAGIATLTFFVCRHALRAARIRRVEAAYKSPAAVTIGGRTAELRGFLDTGNGLYDERTELPIVVIKLTSLYKAFDRNILRGRVKGYVAANTIAGTSGLFLVRPDKFILYSGNKTNKYNDVMLGVSETGFARKEDMLLHPSVIGG